MRLDSLKVSDTVIRLAQKREKLFEGALNNERQKKPRFWHAVALRSDTIAYCEL